MNKKFGYRKQGVNDVYYSPRTGQGFKSSSVAEAPASAKAAQARRVMSRAEVYQPLGIPNQAARRTMAIEKAKGRNTYMNPTRQFSPEEFERAQKSSDVKQAKLMNKLYRQRFK